VCTCKVEPINADAEGTVEGFVEECRIATADHAR
jgi:hypothetical protein